MSATAELGWPTFLEVNDLEKQIYNGGVDPVEDMASRLGRMIDRDTGELADGVAPPTVEDVGALSVLVEWVSLTVTSLTMELERLRQIHYQAVYALAEERAEADRSGEADRV